MLRFIAALLIVFAHSEHEITAYGPPVALALIPNTLFDYGIGVDIFFCISGFVLSLSLARSNDSFYGFMKGRFIRIVPLYWIFTSLFLILSLVHPEDITNDDYNIGYIISSYIFIPAPRADGLVFPLLSLGWTLNFEMFFYIILGFSLFCVKERFKYFTIFIILIVSLSHCFVSAEYKSVYFLTQPLLLEFASGIILADIFQRGLRLSVAKGGLLVCAGFAWAIATYGIAIPYDWARVVNMGIAATLICAGTVFTEGKLGINAVTRFLILGGGASYALYLSHLFILRAIRIGAAKIHPLHPYAYMIVAAACAVGVSLCIHLWLELPLTSFLRQRFGRRRATKVLQG